MQRVLSLLKQANLDLDPEEIADMLWLAGYIDSHPVESAVDTKPSIKPDNKQPEKGNNTRAGDESLIPQEVEPSAKVVLPPVNTPEIHKAVTTVSDLPFKAPTAPALRNPLELGRALRPLMRKVPSRTEMILDEEATAIAIAESPDRQWLPVLKPSPERWLDLTLVVENTKSTVIWQELIVEVQQLLERLGAFRLVRVWTLQTDVLGELQLFPRRMFEQQPQRSRRPKELLDPSGRQLILVLSDCVSPMWRTEKIHPWLKVWSDASFLAILQLFPERLWERTALGLGSLVSLSAFTPGTTNARLEVYDLPLWEQMDRVMDIILPILTLEPSALSQWARVMGGMGSVQTAGVVFSLGSKATEAITITNADRDLPKLSPEELVQRFRATASRLARQLAVLMSIVPVSLPVIHLIQEAMLPASRQEHIAEVFMSGLLVSMAMPNVSGTQPGMQYEFVDGVREILQGSASKSKTLRLWDRVAEYIADRLGLPQRSFAALLRLWSEQGNIVEEEVLHFAKISTQMLRRMGGDYAAWVDDLEQRVDLSGWQTAEFEVKTIEFSDEPALEPYEFEVATLRFTEDVLELDDVFRVANAAMKARTREEMTALQLEIIEGTWKKHSYAEIADREGLSTGHVSKVGAALFQALSEELRKSITKKNMVEVLGKIAGKPMRAGYEIVRVPGRAEQFVESLGNGDALSLSKGVELEMVRIPAGKFMMGSPDGEEESFDREKPQHSVTVPEFYLGKYPVTQAQWRAVAGLPRVGRELEPEPSRFKGDDLPVEQVSWFAAVEFCQRLSAVTGREYRLPSEAEWEYACRAGTTTPFHFGETISTDVANYNGNYVYGNGEKGVNRKKTTTVGIFNAANNFGLHDMHGNVLEWCLDHCQDGYEGAPNDGTAWIDPNAERDASRRLRGGSWGNYPRVCRSAFRFNYDFPDDRHYGIGFRVVCVATRTP